MKKTTQKGFRINFRLFIILFFIALILPFIYVTKGLDPALFPRFFGLTIVVALVNVSLLFSLRKKQQAIALSSAEIYILLALAGFCVIAFVSSWFAINMNEAIFETLKIFTLANFFFQIIILLKTQENASRYLIISTLIFSCCILAIAVFQFLKLDFTEFFTQKEYLDYFYNQQMNKVTGTQANKNLLASLVFICTAFGLLGYIWLKGALKMTGLAVTILCIAFIGLLATRSVWVGALFALFVFILLAGINFFGKLSIKNISNKINPKHIIAGILLVFTIGAGLYVTATYKEGKIIDLVARRFTQAFTKDDLNRQKLMNLENPNSAQTRLIVWYKTIDLFNQNPVLGIGPGNWRIAIPSQNLDAFEYDVRQGLKKLDRPHNDFLWVLSETGIFGFLLWYGVFFYICILAVLIFFNATQKTDKHTGLIAIVILSGYALISFLDFPRERIEHQMLLMVLLALVIHTYDKMTGNPLKTIKNTVTLPVFVVMSIVSLLAVSAAYGKFNGELQSNKIIQSQLNSNWNAEINYLKKTNSWFYNLDAYGAPIDWYRGIALLKTNQYDRAVASLEKAYQRNPYHLGVLNNLAGAYFITNNLEKSEQYYEKALAVSSTYEEALINLAIIYIRKEKTERAYQTILKVKPTNTTPANYTKVLGVILQKKTEKLSQKVTSRILAKKLLEISKDQKYLVNIQNNAIKNQKTFKEQLLLSLKK